MGNYRLVQKHRMEYFFIVGKNLAVISFAKCHEHKRLAKLRVVKDILKSSFSRLKALAF